MNTGEEEYDDQVLEQTEEEYGEDDDTDTISSLRMVHSPQDEDDKQWYDEEV